jgi:hypothetical protein
VIFVDKSTEDRSSSNLCLCEVNDGCRNLHRVVWGARVQFLVRAVLVVVTPELAQDFEQVTFVDDEDPV